MKVEKEVILLKVLDEDFFFNYEEHWVNEFKGQGRQMSFVCIEDCPLDDLQIPASYTCLINVVDLSSDPENPELKVWYCTPDPGNKLRDVMDKLAAKDKTVADADIYIEVSKKQEKNKRYSYTVSSVKLRDLEEDWPDIQPLSKKELADFEAKRYSEDDCIRITPRRDLLDIADELSE